jgi:arsenite-transporting ATPase
VINQSLTPVETTDPVLRSRQANEDPYISEVTDRLAAKVAMIPWLAEPPVGVSGLRATLGESRPTRTTSGS